MSRSYREPWYTDGYKGSMSKRYRKRYANKKVRNTIDVPEGKAYRKCFESWNICDYKFLYDPYPRYQWINGEMIKFDPLPFYKVRRK